MPKRLKKVLFKTRDENGNLGFLDLIIHDYNRGKDIRIKPSKRGTFTKAAKAHGMSV